ncbi:helix-turn-helix domain-containing protein [Ferrovibrio sp.]|uniref:helix-turn-helix domain-containing protein n=1 Tax=Ferrovibrio sp. TaxID=1917215 RepID=UPI002633B2FE|nr:helix-turn-helix domain-containing protein [Ferrovibrio sp.]
MNDMSSQSSGSRPGFPGLLKHWRGLRHLSQLGLATEAGISARHLCFLETGRSQPSREMVVLLARVLAIPLAEQNALLVAAGFAPLYAARDLAAPELAPARQALEIMLAHQEPFPALVLDESWEVRLRNQAASRLFGALRPHYDMPPHLAVNALHSLCHPGGMRRFMVGGEDFIAAFLQMLQREASQGLNAAAARLRAELLAYPGIPELIGAQDDAADASPMALLRYRLGRSEIAFFVTLTQFAMPRDVTLQQVKFEGFFPADEATASWAKRLAADPALSVFD